MVTDDSVKLYRRYRKKGVSQEAAAASAGMTPKTARKYEALGLPSSIDKSRNWRTREDPLAAVWESVLVPLLRQDERGELQATTLLATLKEMKPEQFSEADHLLRTLQRRLRDWKATNGANKEVFFEQEHPPGRQAQFDFTDCNELSVTILGVPFEHKFFEVLLTYSRHRFVQLCYSETFEATVKGVQDGYEDFGGLTVDLRSDNLSAATQELQSEAGRTLTKRFKGFIEHLGVTYSRIQPGKSNENGVVERGHQTFKTALRQALIVRGSRDFLSIDRYVEFAQIVVNRLNQAVQKKFEEERKLLKPLRPSRVAAYTDVEVMVRKWSTIQVRANTYSVPSRLIGHYVLARVHPDQVEVLYGDKTIEIFPRLRGKGQQRIDYRHVVHSLVRKPGAFAHWRYREQMFPTLTFRRAYDALIESRGARADIEYLRVLYLAATTVQAKVEKVLEDLLATNGKIDSAEIRAVVEAAPMPSVPLVPPVRPTLSVFDNLLSGDIRALITSEQHILEPTPPSALNSF